MFSFFPPLVGGSDGKALIGLWFDGQKYFADVLEPMHKQRPDLPVFEETRQWLDEYFSEQEPQFTPPLTFRGSDFRKRVWQRLLEIPYGQTKTYGEIARMVGCKSARAVGQAIGHNPISLIIPCLRVVGANGTLGGYAYGPNRKKQLLELEK